MSEDHPWLLRYKAPEAEFFADERLRALEAIMNATTSNEKAAAEGELKKAHAALYRIDSYRTEINKKLQCPHCLIADGVQSDLHRIPRDSRSEFYKCGACDREYENDWKKN